MQGHKYSYICNLWGKFLPVGMICTTKDTISIPVGEMYLHASSNVLFTRSYVFYSHGCNKLLYARMFFALADTTSIHVECQCVEKLECARVCEGVHVCCEVYMLHGALFSVCVEV